MPWCHAFTGATGMGAVQAALQRVQATRPPDGHGAGLCIYARGQALCTVPRTVLTGLRARASHGALPPYQPPALLC